MIFDCRLAQELIGNRQSAMPLGGVFRSFQRTTPDDHIEPVFRTRQDSPVGPRVGERI